MVLTREQKGHYYEESYVVLPRLFSSDALEDVQTAIEEVIAAALSSGAPELVVEFEPSDATGTQVPRRLHHPFEQHATFRRLATDATIMSAVTSLLGPNVYLQHSKLNMKPPRSGSAVRWHQDLAYFPHTNDDLVAVVIHLDDATEENGCIQVLPRCHGGFLDHSLPDGTFAGMITEDIACGRYGEPVSVPAAAGSVLFLHPLAPHASSANLSGKPRRMLIFQYRASDCFPLFIGEHVARAERFARLVSGRDASFARCAGPPQAIYRPRGAPRSLFELQEASVQALDRR